MPNLLKFYEKATRAAAPLLKQLLARRVKTGKEDPARLNERMGIPSRPRPEGPLIWIHAASVGEAQSALILIDAIGKLHGNGHILVTTGTVSSANLMQTRLPPAAFHQYAPLDHPGWVESFLDHWRPGLALWMESELWPNTITALHKRRVPVILVNARLSDRSFAKWRLLKKTIFPVLDCFSLILAQTPKDEDHFKTLGANHVFVTDNLKYSASPLPCDPLALSALKAAVDNRPVWVYASTHAGEEDLACRVHKTLKETIPNLLTVIVPRHPARRDDIASVCFSHGLKFRLRSHHTALPAIDDDIYIADTMGELGLFYTLCPVAMIGRSFSDDGGGGHNPIEAAQLGCAVLTGPNNQFQQQIYDDMAVNDAVMELSTEDDLTNALETLLTDPQNRHALQEQSTLFARKKAHVVDAVMEKIAPVLMMTQGSKHAA